MVEENPRAGQRAEVSQELEGKPARRRDFVAVTKETIKLGCKTLFSSESSIRRVELEVRMSDDDEEELDLSFLVDGDLYDSESHVLPLVVQLMRQYPTTAIDFVILLQLRVQGP